MKKTTKMSRAIGQLEGIYNTINAELFSGELPTPIITIQSAPGSWGHCTISKIWRGSKEDGQYELNLSAESVDSIIEEILDTIIHEMIHLYCRENNIKEVSRNGYYHNQKFKDLAESKGLKCYPAGKYGWNTQGKDNDFLTEYALKHNWSEIKIGRDDIHNLSSGTSTTTVNGNGIVITGGKAPSSTRKYQCPICKNSVRATKAVNIACLDCGMKMEVVR